MIVDTSAIVAILFDEPEGDRFAVDVAPMTAGEAFIASRAAREYGRGSGHRARLNYGDCFAYALATELDAPLLFKGNDLGHTDVRSARY